MSHQSLHIGIFSLSFAMALKQYASIVAINIDTRYKTKIGCKAICLMIFAVDSIDDYGYNYDAASCTFLRKIFKN